MTENESIDVLQYLLGHENTVDKGTLDATNCLNSQEKEALKLILEEIQQYRAIGLTMEVVQEVKRMDEEQDGEILGMIKSLKELGQYRAIGTVEECRTAVERMKPRKPIKLDTWGEYYKCPVCGKFAVDNLGCKYKFCRECGTKFDWSE